MEDAIIVIHEKDNVAVTLRDLEPGEAVLPAGRAPLAAAEAVPAGHKIALRDIGKGEEIIKYGEAVGVSTTLIQRGAWVHTHNLEGGKWRTSAR